jgi:uncharacterized protein YfdQ (DUF2303 family)
MSYGKSDGAAPVPTEQREIKALLEAGAAIGKAKENKNPDGREYGVIPAGWELAELPTVKLPARAAGLAKLRDTASFVCYFNDHKTAASRIYAQLKPARFLAVFDDFPKSRISPEPLQEPAWREFRAEFAIPPSPEWAVWNAHDKQAKNQVAFAEFIQDNAPDVVDPSGAALMEMALNFQSVEDGSLVSAVRLANGDTTFAIKSETKLAEGIKVPEFLTLRIPVFENGDVYSVRARMRYRARDKLTFWYELERPHKVLEQAFKDAWKKIADDTEAAILLGSPE